MNSSSWSPPETKSLLSGLNAKLKTGDLQLELIIKIFVKNDLLMTLKSKDTFSHLNIPYFYSLISTCSSKNRNRYIAR